MARFSGGTGIDAPTTCGGPPPVAGLTLTRPPGFQNTELASSASQVNAEPMAVALALTAATLLVGGVNCLAASLALLGLCSYVLLYTVLLKKLPVELRGLPVLGYTVTLGTVLILPFYLLETWGGRPVPLSPASIASILYVAIFPSVLAYLFWNHATVRLGPERTGQFSHLIPVFGVLIATLVLGESLQTYHFAGILLVGAGLLLANFRSTKAG